ncbi:MAG: hypothetical protein EBZ36_11400 [Acidobacteria bacterium]|nr:hypothetical protein [Acidobacteriota bacterium]
MAMETVESGEVKVEGGRHFRNMKWLVVILSGVGIYLCPTPDGITDASWRLLAIFMATIVGSILRPGCWGLEP